MIIKRTVLLRNRYFDSVFLMLAARRIADQPGMVDASALLATEANRKVLAAMGYEGLQGAGPNDLALALEGEEAAVAALAADPEAWLARSPGAAAAAEPRSIAEAAASGPRCDVAVLSVPGAHAAREARAALEAGLNVFLFSSNVSVEDERTLKLEAQRRNLIVMGPDCGTAYLGGAGLGFANAVRRGPIGVVAASGTGLQEFSCLVHQGGSGLSHGLGTGGRDLADAVGGLSTLTALDALEADPGTRVVAVLAKPPGPKATAQLQERLARCPKPVVLCLLGTRPEGPFRTASTLDEAAALALVAAGLPALSQGDPSLHARALAAIAGMRPEQRHLRGLFAGGTFCYQAQALFREAGLTVHSNAPLDGMPELPDHLESVGDTVVDLGAEEFVEGRPHPMIDASQRRLRLQQEAADPTVALLLLDFILGAIASPDPVGDLLSAIRAAHDTALARGGRLCVVASVCGTDGDAQGLEAQTRALAEAGVLVFPSAARAAAFCREAMLALRYRKEGP